VPNLFLEPTGQFVGCFAIGFKVEVLDLLSNDPVGHRINIITDDVASYSISLEQGRAAPHKRVCDSSSPKIIFDKEVILKAAWCELGQ
jgi:hypothetical protein